MKYLLNISAIAVIIFALFNLAFTAQAASVPAFKPSSIGIGNPLAGDPSTSGTLSYNASGTNPLIICTTRDYTTNPGTISMSYNGQSFTAIGPVYNNSLGANEFMQTFYLEGSKITLGVANIIVNTSNSVNHYVSCSTYENTNQTLPIDTFVGGTGAAQIISTSTTITTTGDNELIVTLTGSADGRQHTAGAGNIERVGSLGTIYLSGTGGVFDASTIVSPAGTFTSNITADAIEHWIITAVAIKPFISTKSVLYGNYYGTWYGGN